ncbi:MAG TPA: hypothetical protein VMZ01_00670 [Aestuariivirga sp.]|nr:hypothetical protein [Aestuariivirga sp.]
MSRPLNQIPSLRIAFGVIIALGLGAARSEKIWAEVLNGLPGGETAVSQLHQGHEPFDPRRVPQSGGMASRLLAGISVKHA